MAEINRGRKALYFSGLVGLIMKSVFHNQSSGGYSEQRYFTGEILSVNRASEISSSGRLREISFSAGRRASFLNRQRSACSQQCRESCHPPASLFRHRIGAATRPQHLLQRTFPGMRCKARRGSEFPLIVALVRNRPSRWRGNGPGTRRSGLARGGTCFASRGPYRRSREAFVWHGSWVSA